MSFIIQPGAVAVPEALIPIGTGAGVTSDSALGFAVDLDLQTKTLTVGDIELNTTSGEDAPISTHK
ncbi:MAG: hypothetical protein IPO08_23590 [Xanthomonadales bacterium]|nr:hypothetical protein [Xanthomonadales bacterium]